MVRTDRQSSMGNPICDESLSLLEELYSAYFNPSPLLELLIRSVVTGQSLSDLKPIKYLQPSCFSTTG